MQPTEHAINNTIDAIEQAAQNIITLCSVLAERGPLHISQDKARQIADMMETVVPGCREDAHFYTYMTYRIDVEGFGQLRLVFNPRYQWKQGASILLV